MLILNAHSAPSGDFLKTIFRRSFALLSMCALLPATLTAQNDKDMAVLEPGKPVERELAGNAAYSFHIRLATNQFLHVVVEQKGIDVVVALFAPDGKKVAEVDSPNGTQGPEPISVVAKAAGNYRLEVRSPEAKAAAGRYQASIKELRAAQPQDRNRIGAQQAFAEAEQLRGKGSADSLRKAIDKYQEALPFLRAINDRAGEAETLNVIGLVYASLGEKQQALNYLKQALPLRRAARARRGEAATLNNIAFVYNSRGEKQQALKYYKQALLLFPAGNDRRGEATTLSNIGAVYASLGEKQQALDYFNRALLLGRAARDRNGEAYTLNNIGLVYDTLGEKEKALDHYKQALPLFNETKDRRGEATTLNNIGAIYDTLDDQQKALDYKQKALDYYNQALRRRREVGDRSGEAATVNNIGVVYASLGEQQKALDNYDEALRLFREDGDRNGEAYTLSNVGRVYASQGEQRKALDHFNQALPLRRIVGDRGGEAVTLADIAKSERDRGNLIEARARIEAALTIVESLRTKIASHELRSSYFATVQQYYDFYIDLLMRLHGQQPSAGLDGVALRASERKRARSLLEILVEANADVRQGVNRTLVARERSLQQQLNAKAQEQIRLLNGRHTDAQATAMAKEVERLTTEFQQTQTQIRQTSPRYAALTQPQPLTLYKIQKQLLDRDTLLLEYALGDEKSYLWAVTPTSITSYELPKRAEIEAVARQFYTLLTARRQEAASGAQGKSEIAMVLRQQADQKFAEVASGLSRMLLAPVAGQLGQKRLLIVGDGALQYIPFGALPAPSAGDAAKMDAAQPLVVAHEIVNLPSASTLAVLRRETRGHKRAPKAVAVLADPVFERTDERIKKRYAQAASNSSGASPGADVQRGLGLVLAKTAKESGVAREILKIPRLPSTRREAEQIIKLVPAAQRKQAFDFAASRQAATDPELSQYRYVHFATHGFLNSQHPEFSGLMFTMFDEEGQAQDGFLGAHEVFNLRLSADVVVLSACQTGLGKEVRGEGLVGLTRGFMYAGAPRVVVSLWNVSDAATAELMTRFYRGMLVEKLRPAKALQAAQVSMLKDKQYASPFYWAAFTLQGEWR